MYSNEYQNNTIIMTINITEKLAIVYQKCFTSSAGLLRFIWYVSFAALKNGSKIPSNQSEKFPELFDWHILRLNLVKMYI